jgi:hypothetical protein
MERIYVQMYFVKWKMLRAIFMVGVLAELKIGTTAGRLNLTKEREDSTQFLGQLSNELAYASARMRGQINLLGGSMPDEQGLLSAEEREKCAAWFKEHGSDNVQCPICKTNEWEVEDRLVKTHVLIPGRRNVEGVPVYAFFMVCCRKCRHTMFINAVDAKIIKNRPPESSESSDGWTFWKDPPDG